jgi:teichuronic acid biosynthesis glycosyltransferase TuaG
MADELVSIITPAYNCARFLEETVKSVQAQTHANWEMIVVDDCSKDDTRAVLERLAAADGRIRPILQPVNGGPAKARNTALAAARGPMVAFLDSDDCWLPDKLEKQLAFLRGCGSGFTFTEFRRINADGSEVGKLRRVPSRLTYHQLLKNTAIATSTVLIDRAVTGDFRMPKAYYDDFTAWLSVLKRGVVAHGMHQDLMRYRVVGKSVSRNKLRSAYMIWRALRDVEKLNLPYAAWCFVNYAARGWLKYRSL